MNDETLYESEMQLLRDAVARPRMTPEQAAAFVRLAPRIVATIEKLQSGLLKGRWDVDKVQDWISELRVDTPFLGVRSHTLKRWEGQLTGVMATLDDARHDAIQRGERPLTSSKP